MIIDKILDKYYFKKLKEKVKETINIYCIDYKFEKSRINDSYVYLKIKNKKYNDKFYEEIGTFNTTNAFDDLLNYEEIAYKILKSINEYFEEKGEDRK